MAGPERYIECLECEPDDNRFMRLERTYRTRASTIGPEEDVDLIGVYRCTKDPSHVKEQALPEQQNGERGAR